MGTDIGVFSTGNANWTEVGPDPSSSTPGFLPNVPVTALRMFDSGGTKKLRASTYGRGIWEFALVGGPDFQFSVPNNTETVFAGETATYTGTLAAENCYNSGVSLSCAKGATSSPPTCSVTPSSVPPPDSFSVTASGPAGDYFFDVQGSGTDSNTTTRNFSLSLSNATCGSITRSALVQLKID